MAGNCSETVVQLDGQEQSIEMEQRHVITEAVRKFSALAKSSASRTGKPFFSTLTKSSKPVVHHPWPSTTNIPHSAQIQTPISTPIEAASPWRKDSFKSFCQSSIDDSEGRQPSVSSDRSQEGVVNSAFTEEKLHDVPDICDCDNMEEEYDNSGPPHHHEDYCQHSQIPETIDMPVISEARRASSPKYIKRNQSISDSKKKKSFQWPKLSSKQLKFRRRTTDNIPVIGTMMSPTSSSSPNLRNLEERKTARSVKIDSSCKQEDDSKLWIM